MLNLYSTTHWLKNTLYWPPLDSYVCYAEPLQDTILGTMQSTVGHVSPLWDMTTQCGTLQPTVAIVGHSSRLLQCSPHNAESMSSSLLPSDSYCVGTLIMSFTRSCSEPFINAWSLDTGANKCTIVISWNTYIHQSQEKFSRSTHPAI